MPTHAAPRAGPVRRRPAALSGLLAGARHATGLTPAGLAVAAAIVPVLAAGQRLGSPSVVLIGYGAAAVLVLSRALARRRLAVSATRTHLPARLRVGQSVDVELTVTTSRRLAGVVLSELLPPALGAPVRLSVADLPAGQSLRHGYRLPARARGVHQVGPLVAEWSDPFGLTRRRVTVSPAQTLIVHPSTEGVQDRITSREWEDPPLRPPRSKPWPTGFEFYGMREYVPGDDPRRIVWTASARTEDRLMVRESEQGITDRVSLLLDTDAARHTPGTPSETFEQAVRAAASLGVRHLKDGLSVTLEANSGRLAASLRGGHSRIPFLDQLAAVQPEDAPLDRTLDRLFLERSRNTHNVLITPHLAVAGARRVSVMLARGTSVLLVLVLSEDTDAAMLHRAGTLGCPVVELRQGASLDRTFARIVGSGRR